MYRKIMSANVLANVVCRWLGRKAWVDNVELVGRSGRRGHGVLFEAVKVQVGDRHYLVDIREVEA